MKKILRKLKKSNVEFDEIKQSESGIEITVFAGDWKHSHIALQKEMSKLGYKIDDFLYLDNEDTNYGDAFSAKYVFVKATPQMLYDKAVALLQFKGATEEKRYTLSSVEEINEYIETPVSHHTIPLKIKSLWTKFNSIFAETEEGEEVELEMSSFSKGTNYELRYPEISKILCIL